MMNNLALIACLLVTVGIAFANPAVRDSRHVVPVAMMDGMVLMDDDVVDGQVHANTFNPIVLNPRTLGALSNIGTDQQTEEQRWGGGYGRPYGGGWGGGYGGGWGGGYGRPYGGGWGGGYGRPYGGGWGGGYGRPFYG